MSDRITELEAVNATLLADRDQLRAALIESLIVWENNSLQDHIQSGPFIDDIINVALSTTPAPHPDKEQS